MDAREKLHTYILMTNLNSTLRAGLVDICSLAILNDYSQSGCNIHLYTSQIKSNLYLWQRVWNSVFTLNSTRALRV
jgi:hypothetical protein